MSHYYNLENNNFLNVSLREYFNSSEFESESENKVNSIFPSSSLNEIPIFYEEDLNLREIENNEKEEKKLYFIDKSEEKKNKSFLKFAIEKEKSSKNRFELIQKKRKRGRPKAININDLKKYNKIHDKNKTDNLLRKIQVHYFSFIVSFLNNILRILNYKRKFLKLNHEYKSNINKNFINSLKEKTLGQIICNKISNKYKYKEEDSNILLYNKIKRNTIMKKVLEINYLKLFEIYYESKKRINLKEYGIDRDIVLTDKIKMYNDLLQNKKFNEIDRQKIEESIKKNFFNNSKLF